MLKNNRYQMKDAEGIVKNSRNFSIALIQKRLGVGYLAASRILKDMKSKECIKKRAPIACARGVKKYYNKKNNSIRRDTQLNPSNMLLYIYPHGDFPLWSIQDTYDIIGDFIPNKENIDVTLKIDDTMVLNKVKYILVWYENLSKDKEEESPSIQ